SDVARDLDEIFLFGKAVVEALIEVASDIGIQLGLGHPRTWEPDQAESSRRALTEWLTRERPELERLARRMTVSIERAWEARR
ncbi:MAG: hypothetical protein AAF658_16985, partial [Myxococcota bacterium]